MIEFSKVLELGQACLRQTPAIVLGSGASVSYGIPGMWLLGEHLANSCLPPTCSSADDIGGWEAFVAAVKTQDLESALTATQVTAAVTEHIVAATWNYLNAADISVFEKVVQNRRLLSLTRLYEYLFNSTHLEIDVVTPNYDRIAEYAAEAGGFLAFTGFGFQLVSTRSGAPSPKVFLSGRQVRTVNVWKVHGSFGWFGDQYGAVYALPPVSRVPDGLRPIIVTPGVEKYRRTHDEPFRSVMQRADDAVKRARGFLCIGFGFNDPHLQPLLMERCGSPDVPLVLLTKQVSLTAHEMLKSGRYRRYLAIEECDGGSRVFCNEVPDGIEFREGALWSLDGFLDRMI